MLYLIIIVGIAFIVIVVLKLKESNKHHEETFKEMIEGLPDETLNSIKDSLDKLDSNPVKDRAIEIIEEEKSKR